VVRTVAQEHFERLQESLAAWKQNNEEMRGESTLLHRTVQILKYAIVCVRVHSTPRRTPET